MATFVPNIALGRCIELHDRVKNNDPANSALILVPLETAGLVSDATLADYDNLSDLLAGATNEQTTMGRKTLTDADLASTPAPDDTNNRNERSLPTVTWAAAAGNPISKIAVCYDSDTTSGTDTSLIPISIMDAVLTPSGTDFVLTGGVYLRANPV